MRPEALISALESRGVSVTVDGEELVLRPARAVTAADVAALRERKAEILGLLRARDLGADWRAISLYEVDKIVELRIPGFETTLILCPGCRVAQELRKTDSQPGRIWCVCEVIDLVTSGVTPGDARAVAQARVLFDAQGTGVRQMKGGKA